MSKALSWTLFTLLAFAIFALFQFDAESRRKHAELEEHLNDLNLKLSSYIRLNENDPSKQELTQVDLFQKQLEARIQQDKKTMTELLDLLVGKDEKFSRELHTLKSDLDSIKTKLGLNAQD